MIKEENLPRIRELILELNELAQKRKDIVDKLWILTEQNQPDQFKDCTDKLWSLEDMGESLRNELMQLLDHP